MATVEIPMVRSAATRVACVRRGRRSGRRARSRRGGDEGDGESGEGGEGGGGRVFLGKKRRGKTKTAAVA